MHSIPVLWNWHYYRICQQYWTVLISIAAISRKYSRICRLQDLKTRHFINIDVIYLSILISRTFDAVLINIDNKNSNLWQLCHSIDQYCAVLMENKILKINIDQYWSIESPKTVNIGNTARKILRSILHQYWCNIVECYDNYDQYW